ncbi:MAG: hypothetical protein JOY69_08955 [Candidatus Eremiobacteraeota bacterium]|nr:hypothetical protein [Candidatus Eremiobacteraeota bacterium]
MKTLPHVKSIGAALLLFGPMVVAMPAPGLAYGDPALLDGRAWPAKRLPCTNATVSQVRPRLDGSETQTVFTKADFDSGVEVIFALPKGYRFFNAPYDIQASVTHYQNETQNALMMNEKPGDRVQVCLIGTPTPEYNAAQKLWICNPDYDARGYSFRVYDYKRHAAYYGGATEHGCGGA